MTIVAHGLARMKPKLYLAIAFVAGIPAFSTEECAAMPSLMIDDASRFVVQPLGAGSDFYLDSDGVQTDPSGRRSADGRLSGTEKARLGGRDFSPLTAPLDLTRREQVRRSAPEAGAIVTERGARRRPAPASRPEDAQLPQTRRIVQKLSVRDMLRPYVDSGGGQRMQFDLGASGPTSQPQAGQGGGGAREALLNFTADSPFSDTIFDVAKSAIDLERMVSEAVPTIFLGGGNQFSDADFGGPRGENPRAEARRAAANLGRRVGGQSVLVGDTPVTTPRMALSLLASMAQQPLFYVLIFAILALFLLAKLRRS